MSELALAKKKISDCLGANTEKYIQNLKSWFKQRISKEEFDFEARRLLKPESAYLHNEFLLAIFMKCQQFPVHREIPSVVKKSEPKRMKFASTSSQGFSPVNPLDFVTSSFHKLADDTEAISFCSREMTLPDSLMTHGRVLVVAWEIGLEDIETPSVTMVLKALEVFLKNVLTAVFSIRSGFNLREGRFKHALGSPVPNPYLRHTAKLLNNAEDSDMSLLNDDGPESSRSLSAHHVRDDKQMKRLACVTHDDTVKPPVSLFQLFMSLQMNKSVIPSHTIYSTVMERIIHNLWHPSNEDLHFDLTYRHTQPQSTISKFSLSPIKSL